MRNKMRRRLVGVLGGMGPLATLDFMQKIVRATPAKCDQDHVPLIVHAVPQIPDRSNAIMEGLDDPFPALVSGVKVLERSGAELLVMPCNTAHAWYDRLAASTAVPILHIAEAVQQSLDLLNRRPKRIALMATIGTVRVGFYHRYLSVSQVDVILPEFRIQEEISRAVAAVKVGDLESGCALAEAAATALLASQADALLLACTELPIALASSKLAAYCVDATFCLAEACVSFSLGKERAYMRRPPRMGLDRPARSCIGNAGSNSVIKTETL